MICNTSSFIQTVLSVPESHRVSHQKVGRGLYRRSGISPCPEDIRFSCLCQYYNKLSEKSKEGGEEIFAHMFECLR